MATEKTQKKRATFIIDETLLNDFYNIAYWSRESITDAAGNALTQFIDAWKADKSNKAHISGSKIKQRPEGK